MDTRHAFIADEPALIDRSGNEPRRITECLTSRALDFLKRVRNYTETPAVLRGGAGRPSVGRQPEAARFGYKVLARREAAEDASWSVVAPVKYIKPRNRVEHGTRKFRKPAPVLPVRKPLPVPA